MYNFDEIIPRRGSNSYKWDSNPNQEVLPMFVADMDFQAAPAILAALRKRVEHGVFGYVRVPDAYYQAVIDWYKRRHRWTIERDWILYTIGVVPAVTAAVKALTQRGDCVLIQTPVYNCFFQNILKNHCTIVESELVYSDHYYTIDYEDFEQKIIDNNVKVMILCNPHNPAGRVWTREELTRLGNICLKHNVFVIADEIHCEFVFPNYVYTPFASISEEFLQHSATCMSPSKAFNFAGLKVANIVVANPEKRNLIEQALLENEIDGMNPFGVDALMAAYNESEDWINDLMAYLYDNYLFTKDFFSKELPAFPLARIEGTYLVWIDVSVLKESSDKITKKLLEQGNVWLNDGLMYGKAGEHFVRLNIACPRSVLQEGLQRIKKVWG